jgi:acyl carrier protein
MNELIEMFEELFSTLEGYTENTMLKDIEEWSSLGAFITIMTIEERFGKSISEQDFRKCETIADVFKCL